MKILLIGKNGQVGWELQRALSTLGTLIAVDYFDTELCGDLTNPDGIAQTIRTVKPDVIVNAAAHTAVDKAESELTGLPKYIDCWNPVGAKAGDVVGAEYRDFDQRKAKLVIYGLPVAGILAGVACGHSMATFFHMDELPFIAGCIVLWLLVTVNYARIFKRDAVREGKQAVIFEIQQPKIVIDMGKKE